MVLTKDETIAALQNEEVRLVLHLMSQIEPPMLDYRPSPKQRSLLELCRYFIPMAPVQLRRHNRRKIHHGDVGSRLDRAEEANAANAMNLEEVKAAIARQPALFAELLAPCPRSGRFRERRSRCSGNKATRGMWIVRLPITHFAAYRMQLFMYLKACGLDQLNTMNLWAGVDASADSTSDL